MTDDDIPTPAPGQTTVYTDQRATQAALARHRRFIDSRARVLADGDADLADDLRQLARAELWARDPSRYAPEDDEFVRRFLGNVMRHATRRERNRRRIPVQGTLLRPSDQNPTPAQVNLWRPPPDAAG
jgi:hypothetical protein